MAYERHEHPFAPVCNESCRVLILGSFPSVKSRENAFYYGHPQNRFWKVLSAILGENIPETIAEKEALLLRHHIALWDVIAQCDIVGSGDSSIKNAVPNELNKVFARTEICHVFLNGRLAEKLYKRYHEDKDIACTVLPSTSPANAVWSLERLTDAWRKAILPQMGE